MSVIRSYPFLINSQPCTMDKNEPIQGLNHIEDLMFTKPNYSKIWEDHLRLSQWKCFPFCLQSVMENHWIQ